MRQAVTALAGTPMDAEVSAQIGAGHGERLPTRKASPLRRVDDLAAVRGEGISKS